MNRSVFCFAVFVGLVSSGGPGSIHADPAVPQVPVWHSYLPLDGDYDPVAPTPEDVLGWCFGEWHLHHHELVAYLTALSQWSDRIEMVEYARSHGRRPLVMLTVSSPENLANLDKIREAHLERIRLASEPKKDEEPKEGEEDGEKSCDTCDAPLILWMGYGVHGNEPSASQTAPLLAYHLAAARSKEVLSFLEKNVVLIEPCLNPDGMERFAAWSNDHRGRLPSPHRGDHEHVEAWPGGRSNYYWFDLNRDWLPAVHPESRGRLELFHRWMPHVVTDYHEMGNVNRTYFFQPGIPEMVHPLTPPRNQALTSRIARHHAKALDGVGALYYTGESFDDFYIGKGSTYPDLCGSVGILYEQASSRGFHQNTEHGRLTFPVTIRNQITTSLSTLRAAEAMKDDLVAGQLAFHREALEKAAASGVAAHFVAAPGDPVRLEAFRDFLDRHDIRHAIPAKPVVHGGARYSPSVSLLIPTDQPRYHLLTAMMETRTEFKSPVFYDVSAWHLPSAYGLVHAELKEMPEVRAGKPARVAGSVKGAEEALAYLIPWEPLHAPAALFRLCREGVLSWVAQRPLVTGKADGAATYPHGTLVVPASVQENHDAKDLRELMERIAKEYRITIHAVSTGLGAGGIDLGSPSLKPVRTPEVLLVVGRGVSSTAAGDVWHQFDQTWRAPLTLVESSRVSTTLLRDFNTLILADTSFSGLPTGARSAIEAWVSRGGTLVALGSNCSSVASLKWVGVKTGKAEFPDEGAEAGGKGMSDPKTKPDEAKTKPDEAKAKPDEAKGSPKSHPAATPYDEAETRRATRQIKGVVARAWFDPTHPLAYGYSKHGPHLALMRNGTTFLEPSTNSLLNPLHYTDDPLVSGLVASANLEALKKSAPMQLVVSGSGRVVLLTDNPVFRGHWHGSSKLLANAVFFANLVSTASSDDGEEDEIELEEELE